MSQSRSRDLGPSPAALNTSPQDNSTLVLRKAQPSSDQVLRATSVTDEKLASLLHRCNTLHTVLKAAAIHY